MNRQEEAYIEVIPTPFRTDWFVIEYDDLLDTWLASQCSKEVHSNNWQYQYFEIEKPY